jgi:O-antigen/teichoic acid export membrane protein
MNQESTRQSVGRNAGTMMAADVFSRVLGMAAFAVSARALGPGSFGLLNLALGVLAFLALASDPGLQYRAQRALAQPEAKREEVLRRMAGLRGLLALAVLIGAAVSLALLRDSVLAQLVFLYAVSLVPSALSLAWLYTASECAGIRALGQVTGSAVHAAWVFLLVRDPADLFLVPIGLVLANAVSASLLFMRAPRDWRRTALSPSLHGAFSTLKGALPLAATLMLAQSLVWIDSFLLAALGSAEDVGVYHAAYRWVLLLTGLGVYFPQALFPALSREGASRRSELLMREATRIIGIGGVLAALALAGFAGPLIAAAFGPAYQPAEALLLALAWLVPLSIHNSLAAHFLIARGRENRVLAITATVVAANIGLNLILIPAAGPAGAAAALLVAESLSFLLCLASLREMSVPLKANYAPLGTAFAAAAAAFAILSARPAMALSIAALAFLAVLAARGELSLARLRGSRDLLWRGTAEGELVASR